MEDKERESILLREGQRVCDIEKLCFRTDQWDSIALKSKQ